MFAWQSLDSHMIVVALAGKPGRPAEASRSLSARPTPGKDWSVAEPRLEAVRPIRDRGE